MSAFTQPPSPSETQYTAVEHAIFQDDVDALAQLVKDGHEITIENLTTAVYWEFYDIVAWFCETNEGYDFDTIIEYAQEEIESEENNRELY